MLLPFQRLTDTAVMSLQTGAELARTSKVLVDPRDLTIVAYELTGQMLDQVPSYLRPNDVRELSGLGLIVDSSDEFIGASDVIRIKEVIDYDFNLIGLSVLDDSGKKLGKIQAYSVDSGSFAVQQLNVKRPLLKSLTDTELLISRSQITEVQYDHVKVKSGIVKEVTDKASREYTNPFRTGNVQPEAIDFESRWH